MAAKNLIINGNFEILNKLGQGGQATVFKVRDLTDNNK
jgi:hypothetical protein